MATSPRPRRTALNADRFPVCTEIGAGPPPGPLGGTLGAIVMDAASGMTGIGGSQPTEEAAIQAATAMCQRKGGKNCRVDITYSNQCGALAWGSNHAVSARGRTLEIASKFAIDACEKTTGKKCEVFSPIAACRCGPGSQDALRSFTLRSFKIPLDFFLWWRKRRLE